MWTESLVYCQASALWRESVMAPATEARGLEIKALNGEAGKLNLKDFVFKLIPTLLAMLALPGCALIHRRGEEPLTPGSQPDKVLYEKATREIDRSRFDVGRLTLQTLINTYPDSEYLSRAKLAIADSYYSEGGVSGLTQAEAEYKDFITFFPTAPEAPEAQFRAGMSHFRMMAKADRDRTETKLAELELKEFLLKYPDSPIMPRVKSRLRQVQEVLAQGDYRIAQFYYQKRAYPAARSRFQEIAESYPNYSEADGALWYLGQSQERLRKSQDAATSYARLLTEHPLSSFVDDAKERLTALHQPIPKATRAMMARAQADALHRPGKDLFQKVGGFLASSPDTGATRHGPVRLGAPKPGEVEVAKGQEPTPGVSTVVAQPVGDAALKSGTPVEPSGTVTTPGTAAPDNSGNDPSAAKPENSAQASKEADKESNPPPTTKKGKRSLFKKIIKPF